MHQRQSSSITGMFMKMLTSRAIHLLITKSSKTTDKLTTANKSRTICLTEITLKDTQGHCWCCLVKHTCPWRNPCSLVICQ